jgi:hypothetical protein
MDARSLIRDAMATAEMVAMAYLSDLPADQWMSRPHPQCNHVNWQVGHLILAEQQMICSFAPGALPALPADFESKYSKQAAESNDANNFYSKENLLEIYRNQRAATLALLEKQTDSDLKLETGVSYAPTRYSMFNMQAAHWLMHCGQWVIVRRNLGLPVVI